MPERITLKAINAELERRGHRAVPAKGDGYFYFSDGEAAEWLNNTVNVPTLNALTLDEWIDEFARLKKLNARIMRGVRGRSARGR